MRRRNLLEGKVQTFFRFLIVFLPISCTIIYCITSGMTLVQFGWGLLVFAGALLFAIFFMTLLIVGVEWLVDGSKS